jgi:septum formation protein
MAGAGYDFIIVRPQVDESTYPAEGRDACQYAKELALVKAKSIAAGYPDSLVIGADTVVDCRGEIIGKPVDEKDAERITRKLFAAPHKVITGLAIVRINNNIELVRADSTTVIPKKMTAQQISEHIRGGSWRDKAGAYAIQETGDEFVEKIEGSMTNVMGLPMELLECLLKEIG